MAMPSNRPDPSSPNAVASAGFATVRKGYDPEEVRELLRMVAAELARLQERERFLDAELRTAQRGAAPHAGMIDEEVVTRLLGEEAARVLSTAREGAAQIKQRAEEAAARLLREATDEAQRLREEAEVEAARKRSDAQADAEAEIELAKQQGREMVNEAREYRERVLNELARRREVARQQIEQLVHGRERLWAAFERARIAAVDVMSELQPLAEPTEFVNLAPTTGPVPLMVPATSPEPTPAERLEPEPDGARDETGQVEPDVDVVDDDPVEAAVDEPVDEPVDEAGLEEAADDEVFEMVATIEVVDADGAVEHFEVNRTMVTESDAEVTPDELHAPTDAVAATAAPEADEELASAADSETAPELDADVAADQVEAEDDAAGFDAAEAVAEVEGADADDEADADVDSSSGSGIVADEREPAPVVELFGDDRRAHRPEPVPSAPAATESARPGARPSVDELFAKLRASRAGDVAQRAAESTVAAVTSELATAAANVGAGEAPAATHPVEPAAPADVPVRVAAPAAAPPVTAPAVAAPAVVGDDSVFRPSPEAPAAVVLTDDSPFARRDEALTPIIVAAARRLKRVLADEQNDVLHTLRRADPVRSVDALVAGAEEHVRRYASAIEPDLLDAALAGARSMGVDPGDVRRTFASGAVANPARDVLATELIDPLRDRLARAVGDVDGDNAELANHVRGIYREWKTQRIDEQLDDVVRMAFGHGALAAAEPGAPVRWIVDPNGPACPDAEDNALAGVVRAGDPFPTDHRCAPAHSGCRCMVVPAGS